MDFLYDNEMMACKHDGERRLTNSLINNKRLYSAQSKTFFDEHKLSYTVTDDSLVYIYPEGKFERSDYNSLLIYLDNDITLEVTYYASKWGDDDKFYHKIIE